MKRKRYDEGGDVMEAANASLESQDIANSMGAGPKNEEAPKAKAAAPKSRVVSKKELEDSGMSLRDYMNKQQGLTRRKEKNPAPKLIDSSNIRSGVRFDDEGLIDPKNIRSGAGMKSGGSVSSASRRADGIATKGKTRGKMC